MEVQQDFKEMLELFNANGDEYLIVGGYALNKRASGRKKDLADLEALGEE